MNKLFKYAALVLIALSTTVYAAGRLQNSDFATSAAITGAGGTVSQLLNTSKVYDSANSQLLDTTIAAKENSSNKATDFTTLNNTLYPTTQATHDEIVKSLSGLSAYFFTNTASDIATYLTAVSPDPATALQTISNAGVVNGQLLATWATVSGSPGITFIPTGVMKFHIHGTQTAGTKVSQVYAEVYKRVLAGTETLLCTTGNTIALTGISAELGADCSISTAITLLATDRIVVKARATVSGGGSAPTMDLDVLGSTSSRIEFPISAGAGSILSVSVASANGFAGSSSGGATPALTLSTTLTSNVVKANGTALVASVAGTDYQAPISTSAAVANQFITSFTAPNTFARAQPAFTDLSGTATAAQLPAPATSAIAALDIDWATLKNIDGLYTKTLSANSTLTFSNVAAGQTVVIALTNTASNYTVTWPAAAHFPGGTAPTQTIGAFTDVITCKAYSGTDARCV